MAEQLNYGPDNRGITKAVSLTIAEEIGEGPAPTTTTSNPPTPAISTTTSQKTTSVPSNITSSSTSNTTTSTSPKGDDGCKVEELPCWLFAIIIIICWILVESTVNLLVCYCYGIGFAAEGLSSGERCRRSVVTILYGILIVVTIILYKLEKYPFCKATENRDDGGTGGTGSSGDTGGAVAMSLKDKGKLPPIKEKKTASVRPQPTVVGVEDEREDTGSAVSKTDIYPKLDGIPETNNVQHRSLPVPPSGPKTRGLSANFEEFPNMPSKKLAPIEGEMIIEEEEDKKKKKKKKKSRKSDDDE